MDNALIEKVLLWVPRYWPVTGGSELHSRRLAYALTEHGLRVRVLTHAQRVGRSLELEAASTTRAQGLDGPTEWVRTGTGRVGGALLGITARLQTQMRLARPLHAAIFRAVFRSQALSAGRDVDVIHAVYNGLTESAELAADIARRLGLPFVWTPLVCTDGPQANAWRTRRFRRLYRRAEALIALTNHERDWLMMHGAAPERVHVCPMAPLIETPAPYSMRSRLGIGNAPLILFLGRVTDDKGYRELLAAAPEVWRQLPQARIALVGPADAAARTHLQEFDDPRLVRMERVTQAEKSRLLLECDLLCLPSRAEALGVVLLEAWACCKPVVTSDLPVLREVVSHEHDGLRASAGAGALANALLRVLRDPASARQMGLNGWKKVLKHYQWADLAARHGRIYLAARQLRIASGDGPGLKRAGKT